jgi:hypothetical protein
VSVPLSAEVEAHVAKLALQRLVRERAKALEAARAVERARRMAAADPQRYPNFARVFGVEAR